MREEFCIAAFRSRQQVMAFERDLRRAVQVYRTTNPGNLIGFYDVWQEPTGRTTVRPAGIE